MNTGFSTLLRVINPADFRYRWTRSAGWAISHHRRLRVRCDVLSASLILPESPPSTAINVISSTLGNLAKHIA